MFKKTYKIDLKPGQRLRIVTMGDVHFDTIEHDRKRFVRFIQWVQEREAMGELVRIPTAGDLLDFLSPTERQRVRDVHETTNVTLDRAHLESLREFVNLVTPIRHCFLGILTGHHHYLFATRTAAGEWQGRSSDAWIAHQLGCDYWGGGVAFIRLAFNHYCAKVVNSLNQNCQKFGFQLTPDECPHPLHLDDLHWHGGGGAQTPGGRVMKRIRAAEIAPTAHIVGSGHDNCVPLRAKALTRHGWREPDALSIGEEILAYRKGTNQCVWAPIRRIPRPGSLPMLQMESMVFRAVSTPDHRWVRRNQHGGHEKLVTSEALLTSDQVVVSARAESGAHSLDSNEAAILGWIVTDGHIRRRDGRKPQAIITQSKPEGITELRAILGPPKGKILASERVSTPTGWGRKPSHVFTLRAAWTNRLFQRIGFRVPTQLSSLVTQLSSEARRAMLEAMLLADGSRLGTSWVFSGKPGPVVEAFEILATLEGYRISRHPHADLRTGVVSRYLLHGNTAGVKNMKRTILEPEEAWCVETDEGTWVMELDGQITITGNSKLAYPRSGLDYSKGMIKRYVIGTGSFQRAYLEGEEPGYAEKMGLIPADLGVTVVDVEVEKRNGHWRVDYHASV